MVRCKLPKSYAFREHIVSETRIFVLYKGRPVWGAIYRHKSSPDLEKWAACVCLNVKKCDFVSLKNMYLRTYTMPIGIGMDY